MTVHDLIVNNPYRVLGIYVDDSPAKEASNKSKIKAFDKVSKTLDIPMPYDDVLQPAVRTAQSVQQAAQDLSLPADRIKFALVWVAASDKPWAAHLNSAVRLLIAGDMTGAMIEYLSLISDADMSSDFVCAVTHGFKALDRKQLAHMLIDIIKPSDSYIEHILLSEESIDPETVKARLATSVSLEKIKSKLCFSTATSSPKEILSDFTSVLSEVMPLLDEAYRTLGTADIGGDVSYPAIARYAGRSIYAQGTYLLRAVGKWVWGDSAYNIKVSGPMPKNIGVYTHCMIKRLLDEIDAMVRGAISSLHLENDRNAYLRDCAYTFDKELEKQYYYINDYNETFGLNRKIKNIVSVGLWLAVMISMSLRLL